MGIQKKKWLFDSETNAKVSHELLTPLSIIQSVMENIRDGVAGEITKPQKRMIEIAWRNTFRLSRQIRSLLDSANRIRK
ncbi:MAG: histidine kinase dimerization/phospho-acceptor domain-containing protein [Deltaproteobacteria bacterium]|nr:histidine kinase dimerization/phospho-acceptor domain-containing protein [Deltaproteobacteria bacterium]